MRRKKEEGLGEKNRGSSTGTSGWTCTGARWKFASKCREDSGVRERSGRDGEEITAV